MVFRPPQAAFANPSLFQTRPSGKGFCRPAAAGESMPAVLPGAAGAFGPSPYAMSVRMRLACFREPDRGFAPKDRRRAAYPLSVSLDAAA